jgi:ABC-type glutathione transport system ATPase component
MTLAIQELAVAFGDREVAHVDSLTVQPGEIVGLVGESGSGKSVTALSVLGLSTHLGATVGGSIKLDGEELIGASEARLREIRGKRVTMIFQSPVTAFNPVFRVGSLFLGALRLHGAGRAEAAERAKRALRDVRLSDAMLHRYPHQLSGGQAQRVAVALALALRSELLLADEPTSALDVTVQAEVLQLIRGLCDEHQVGVLFVTHDLAVVTQLCDRVNVMQGGRIVEHGGVGDTLRSPHHPYTRELVAAVPRLSPVEA